MSRLTPICLPSSQLKETVDRIDSRAGRGDFLAAIYRRPVEQALADAFHYHYGRLGDSARFSLERFDVDLPAEKPDEEVLFEHMDLMRSDHSRFWWVVVWLGGCFCFLYGFLVC